MISDYNNWLNAKNTVNESALGSNTNFQYLEKHINQLSGIPTEINYVDLLNDPKNKDNEGAILNEINFFIDVLNHLDSDSRKISDLAERLVEIVLKGKNTNTPGEPDTIFSDVTLFDGERVSVKASKKAGYSGVLGFSKIKINQILSIIFDNGLSSVTDKQREIYIQRLRDKKDLPNPSGTYSIAACYKKNNDFIIEKSVAISGKELLNTYVANPDKITYDGKGRISAVEVLQNVLGFKPTTTYVIKGISDAEVIKLATDRKIILKKIESLTTPDLKKIEKQFNL